VKLGTLVILTIAALVLVAVLVLTFQEGDRCRVRGGTFYCGYKSTCVCFAPGTVLP